MAEHVSVRPHRRWVILAAACLVQVALGAVYVWSLFAAALGPDSPSHLRLTATEAMEPFEIALGVVVLGTAVGGWLQDRIGPRPVALLGGALYAAGVLIASCARGPDQFGLLLVGYGVIGGFGLGIAYVVPAPMLQKWFPDRRAMATGIAVAGFGFGGVLTAAIAAPVIAARPTEPAAAFLPLGIVYLIMLLLGGAQFRNPPVGAVTTAGTGLTLRAALRTPHWYLLTAVLFANVAVSVAFIGTAAGGARTLVGLSAGDAAVLLSVIAVANGAGRVVWAAISERVGRLTAFCAMFVIQAGCCFMIAVVHSRVAFYVAAILVGLCCGGGFGTMPATVGDHFGLRHAGAIYGCMLVAWSAGGVAGPRWVSTVISPATAATYSTAYTHLALAAAAAVVLAVVTASLAPTGRPEWVLGKRRTRSRRRLRAERLGPGELSPAAS